MKRSIRWVVVGAAVALVVGCAPRYARIKSARQADRCVFDGGKVVQGPASGDLYCVKP